MKDACTLAFKRVKNAVAADRQRAVDLRKEIAITKEGEVLDHTIEVTSSILQGLNEEDFTKLDEDSRSELINSLTGSLLRQELTDVFDGAIAYNANSTTPRKPLVLKTAKLVDDKLTIQVAPKGGNKTWTYTFERGSNVSNPTARNSLYIPGFIGTFEAVADTVKDTKLGLTRQEEAIKARSFFDSMRKLFNSDQDIKSLLGAAANTEDKFNYKRASLKQNYVHGSVRDMKNMLADLHALDNNSITNEVFKQYNDILDSMHPRFFREMNLYINENANHTAGWVDLDKNHILLNISTKMKDGMSNEEIYMHEVIHTMTAWALQQSGFKVSGLRNRLFYLRRIAIQNIKWQDLARVTPELSPKAAKERYDYIFSGNTSEEEFLAYALSNPGLMKLLADIKIKEKTSTGLLNTLKEFFADVMNAVLGNYDFKQRNSDLYTEMHALAFKFAEINNAADNSITKGNVFHLLDNLVTQIEGRFEEFVTKWSDVILNKEGEVIPLGEDLNTAQKMLMMFKFFANGIYNKQYRHAVGHFFTNTGLSALQPDSSLREVFRSIMPNLNDTFETETLHLQTTSIDAYRNTQVVITLENILNKFKIKPTEQAEEALTAIFLESNGSSLFNQTKNNGAGYSADQLQKLLVNEDYRKRTIGRLEARLKKANKKRASWLIGQAKGLGRLMATGKGHEAQLTNSKSIVLGHSTRERHKFDADLFHLVEELAALQAIDFQSKTVRAEAALMLKKEPEAVKNIVSLYEAFKENSQANLFQDDVAHMTEGYIKELFDNTIEMRHEPLSEKEEMAKKGFTLVSKVAADTLIGGRELGIYVSKSYSQAERLRGAVSLGSPQSRGLSLKEIRYKQFGNSKKHAQIYFESDKAKLNVKTRELNDRLANGEAFDDLPIGSVPILDASGFVVNYRNMMEKDLKAKFLKQDRRVAKVLAETMATVADKVARKQQNDKILGVIKKTMSQVVDDPGSKDNLMEMQDIRADHHNPAVRQLYFMLPKSYREVAEARADKSIWVPKILMNQYFGYKHHRLGDTAFINKLPSTVRHIMNMIESYWQDLVKIAKGNVLLKMPWFLWVNILSNVMYARNTGMKLVEIIAAYRDSFRDVKAFMKLHKESEQKKIELAALTQHYHLTKFTAEELVEYKDSVKQLRDEIKRLERQLEKNEIKELYDLGMYQSVIENVETYKLGDTNQISNGMDKLLKKVPAVIKTPLQILYLSKETLWYKINQEVLQVSDLIARDVMNRKLRIIERGQADGKRDLPVEYRREVGKTAVREQLKANEREQFLKWAERNRHHNVLNSFVNYNLPNGKGEEYLNRIGVLMFTKFLKRIQPVIGDTLVKHPIRTMANVAVGNFMFDLEIIQDSALITRAMDDNDFGFLGVLPVYNPMDVALDVFIPALVKLVPEY